MWVKSGVFIKGYKNIRIYHDVCTVVARFFSVYYLHHTFFKKAIFFSSTTSYGYNLFYLEMFFSSSLEKQFGSQHAYEEF